MAGLGHFCLLATAVFATLTAALVRYGQGVPFCGAALINDRYVVTSAWCAGEAGSGSQVLLGRHVLGAPESSALRRTVTTVKIHPLYSEYFDQYNIAVLRFEPPVPLTTRVRPVCLSDAPYQRFSVHTITGWGTSSQAGFRGLVLKENRIITPFFSACSPMLPGLWMFPNTNMCGFRFGFGFVQRDAANRTMSATARAARQNGGFIYDSCNGDIGSALILRVGDRWVADGVVNGGPACGPVIPGVFHQLHYSYRWIVESTQDAAYC
ncbi:serine protease 27-like [Pollicipes pollicipes]|uniref:serine protease 27-like n=1 Tax=Pollicipes pollicipes TaxID=41117 RepID=UPI00188516AA|nr:serine protease 27-like [Pollicipes pollicipes]